MSRRDGTPRAGHGRCGCAVRAQTPRRRWSGPSHCARQRGADGGGACYKRRLKARKEVSERPRPAANQSSGQAMRFTDMEENPRSSARLRVGCCMRKGVLRRMDRPPGRLHSRWNAAGRNSLPSPALQALIVNQLKIDRVRRVLSGNSFPQLPRRIAPWFTNSRESEIQKIRFSLNPGGGSCKVCARKWRALPVIGMQSCVVSRFL